jgi:hypothetical protein
MCSPPHTLTAGTHVTNIPPTKYTYLMKKITHDKKEECQHNNTLLCIIFNKYVYTAKPVLNGPFIKRNIVLNGNIFRSRDRHSIP